MVKYQLNNISEETAIMLAAFFVYNREKFPHVFLLNGEIGVGKTTFSRSYILHEGLEREFSSPTYTLVNVYDLENRIINHFDLYRITVDDYEWIYEYLEKSDEFFLFEWAELHQELFNDYEYIKIKIKYNEQMTRDYIIEIDDKYSNDLEEFLNEKSIVFEKRIITNDSAVC